MMGYRHESIYRDQALLLTKRKGGVRSWFVNCRKVSDEEYKSANSQYKM